MGSQAAPIVCRSLTKRFDGPAVVDDVSFAVPAGTITGFAGANGAGKTTTMRMLLGLVAPTSGTALVAGRPYRDLEHPRRTVGAVLDGPGAHPGHTARAHLAITATSARLPRARIEEVLDHVGLGEHTHRRVGTFSTGMRQRLALAAALLGNPAVMILDEPANGLDPPGIVWMRQLLRKLAAEGRAVLVSSHLLTELAEVADRMVIINRGRLVADAPLAELLDRSRPVVELRCANPTAVVAALDARGIPVQRRPSGAGGADGADGAGDRNGHGSETVGGRSPDRPRLAADDGDILVIEGLSAPQAGELVAEVDAGPVYWLHQQTARFEDTYFELAGTIADEVAATPTPTPGTGTPSPVTARSNR